MIWMLAGLAMAQDATDEAAGTTEPATATDDVAKAAELYETGSRLYEEALYDQAIEAFERAFELSDEPALLFNIANAQERLGDLEGTIETLNRYRIYAPAEEGDRLDRRVRTLETRLLEQKKLEAEQAAAAAANQTDEGPRMEMRPNSTKWALVGAGAATTAVFGTLAAVSEQEGRAAIEAGDKDAYGAPRTLNNVSLALAAVGVGLAGVGIALPSKREVPVVGIDLRKDSARVGLTWTY